MKFKLVESIDDRLIEGNLSLAQRNNIIKIVKQLYRGLEHEREPDWYMSSEELRTLIKSNGTNNKSVIQNVSNPDLIKIFDQCPEFEVVPSYGEKFFLRLLK